MGRAYLGEEEDGQLGAGVEVLLANLGLELFLTREPEATMRGRIVNIRQRLAFNSARNSLATAERLTGPAERGAVKLGGHLDDAHVRVGELGSFLEHGEEVREEDVVREVVDGQVGAARR